METSISFESRSALCIGIDEYFSEPPLEFCVSDAKAVKDTITMPEFSFGNTVLLQNDQAGKLQVEHAIDNLIKDGSTFKLFYFSGHGLVMGDDGFLVTPDSNDTSLGISLKWLRRKIGAPRGTFVVILDCCHAGHASIRGGVPGSLRTPDIERIVPDLTNSRFLLAATESDAVAEEAKDLGHGVFTFYLLEGLLGDAANREGIVTPMGLFDFVATKFETSGRQRPVFKGNQIGKVVLGSGFSSLPESELEGTEASLLDSLEREARSHLDRYIEQVAVPLDEWQSRGFKTSSQLLPPILRWFERTAMEYPDITKRDSFIRARAEANTRLAQLGTLSEGTVTDYGRIEQNLGAGAFGTVWKVKPDGGGPELAFKIYHPHELQVKEKLVRFQRGYRAMATLDHPHIVKVSMYSDSPVGFYMDYINGPNLRSFGNAIDQPAELIQLLLIIAETLQHAHGRNVIHRDVKPENILVTYNAQDSLWEPYLTDFDLAWYSTATQVTREAFGAIFYAAPEQLAKPESADAHSKTTDIFAFGQVAFFLATGTDPVPLEAADNVRALSERLGTWGNLEAAEQFRSLYSNCIQRNPMDRTPNFRILGEHLFRIHRELLKKSPDQPVSVDRFIPELAFALAGLAHQQTDSQVVASRSGRTNIEIGEPESQNGTADLNVTLVHPNLQIPGISNERARTILNSKLDKNLSGFQMVTRRSGSFGNYSVRLKISGVSMNLKGIELCRRIIGRAVDSIEST